MQDMLNNLVYWKLAFFKYFSGLTKIGLITFLSATTGVHWDKLGGFEHFVIVAGAIVAMLTYTEGFLDQTAQKLAAGKPPIGTNGTGNTEHFTNPDVPPSPKP